MKFSELELESKLVKNLEENNFVECTEVQTQAIPKILKNKNLMVQAQTGTGKTASFLIPLIQRIITKSDWQHSSDQKQNKIIGLIIVPTRELATQIFEDAEILGCEFFDINGVVFSGGLSLENQRRKIKGANFIVATPGRLLDFCGRDTSLLQDIEYFVLDECDRLFDMGFYPDLKKIITFLPPAEQRTSLLFSATIMQNVRNLARQSFYKTEEIDVSTRELAVDKIKQEKIMVLHQVKFQLLLGLVSQIKEDSSVLVFTNTKHNAEFIAYRLIYNGINADYINGDLSQNRRQRVIKKFKQRTLTVLIATDVAARGIHVHDLDLVINFDIPQDPQSYIHRIGRTGRAGQDGEALSFVCEKFAYNLEAVESLLGHKIPVYEKDIQQVLKSDLSKGLKIGEIKKKIGKGFKDGLQKSIKSTFQSGKKRRPSSQTKNTQHPARQHNAKKFSTQNTKIPEAIRSQQREPRIEPPQVKPVATTHNKGEKAVKKNIETITKKAITKVSTKLKLEKVDSKKKGLFSALKHMLKKASTKNDAAYKKTPFESKLDSKLDTHNTEKNTPTQYNAPHSHKNRTSKTQNDTPTRQSQSRNNNKKKYKSGKNTHNTNTNNNSSSNEGTPNQYTQQKSNRSNSKRRHHSSFQNQNTNKSRNKHRNWSNQKPSGKNTRNSQSTLREGHSS